MHTKENATPTGTDNAEMFYCKKQSWSVYTFLFVPNHMLQLTNQAVRLAFLFRLLWAVGSEYLR